MVLFNGGTGTISAGELAIRQLASEDAPLNDASPESDVGREQAPRSSGSTLAGIGAGTASLRLLIAGLHMSELHRNLRNEP